MLKNTIAMQHQPSAMWTVASAYAGTTNNSAIRRLLHVAVR